MRVKVKFGFINSFFIPVKFIAEPLSTKIQNGNSILSKPAAPFTYL